MAPEIIVAIIGVETSYGRNFGSYQVLDALVTLAFHYPPRSQFFRGELRQLFLLGDTHMAYPIDELVGSYAGAMGWGQFIPTSVANFARDYDGDGRIDLWNSLPDIIGSVANYFAVHGWKAGGPVAVMASTAADARNISPDGLEPVYPIEQLQAWGYVPATPVDPTELGTLLKLEGSEGQRRLADLPQLLRHLPLQPQPAVFDGGLAAVQRDRRAAWPATRREHLRWPLVAAVLLLAACAVAQAATGPAAASACRDAAPAAETRPAAVRALSGCQRRWAGRRRKSTSARCRSRCRRQSRGRAMATSRPTAC